MKLDLKYVIEILLSKFYNFLHLFPKNIIAIPTYMVVYVPSFEKKYGLNYNEKWRARCAPAVYDFWFSYDSQKIKLEKVNKKYSNSRYILITSIKRSYYECPTFTCLGSF